VLPVFSVVSVGGTAGEDGRDGADRLRSQFAGFAFTHRKVTRWPCTLPVDPLVSLSPRVRGGA
jgi:hypothetical protein